MKSNFPLPLCAGLLLNLVRLLIVHTDTEIWLREHLGLPHWFWHLVGGLAAALMLWGLIVGFLSPEKLEKLQAFKTQLFGR